MLGLLPMTHPPSAPWALSGVQLRALSQGSLVKVLPAWEERVCGWGGGDMELYQKYGDGGEAPGSRACVRIPEMLCLKGDRKSVV